MRVKKDQTFIETKIALRERFARRWHPDGPRVLDCFAGYRNVWHVLHGRGIECREYLGLDIEDRPGCIRADSLEWLRDLAACGGNLAEFDWIDLDAWGSPWAHWAALLPMIRRPTTVALTWTVTAACGGVNLPVYLHERIGTQGFAPWMPTTMQIQLAPLIADAFLADAGRAGVRIADFERFKKKRSAITGISTPACAWSRSS